jgi:hypothetical protein
MDVSEALIPAPPLIATIEDTLAAEDRCATIFVAGGALQGRTFDGMRST